MKKPEEEGANWLVTPIRREDIAPAITLTWFWIAFIGLCVAASRTSSLMVDAWGVAGSRLTTLMGGIGYVTLHYWFLSIPFWGLAFILSSVWALRIPERRHARMSIIIFLLSIGVGLALLGAFIPMAQAAHSIAAPPPQVPPVR